MGQLERSLRRFTFGGRIPGATGFLLVATLAASLAAAIISRHAFSLFELAALQPELVLRGQAWRLVTWVFVEPSPFVLIFGCLCLYWFAAPLERTWGSRRFLSLWFGVVALAGVLTCVFSFIDPAVRAQSYVGDFAISEAMLVAWGLQFPNNVVRMWFVLPLRGLWIAWGTIAVTLIYAAYRGWEGFVPVMVADFAMVAWFYRRRIALRWSAMKQTSSTETRRRRTKDAWLKVVNGGRDDDDRRAN